MAIRNLLFITADQWRAECLSGLGHRVQTPNLDALAKEGVQFTRHFANAVPCGPSRASIHTGMYLQNHRSGTNGTPLESRHTNWAQLLRSHAHDPVLFGYTDTANDPRDFDAKDPILQSYEGPLPGIRPVVQMGTYPDAWADWLSTRGYEVPEPNYLFYTERKDGLEYESGGTEPLPLAIPADEHDTHFMVDQTIDFLSANKEGFCVHLSLLRPHPPWIAPEPYNRLYPPNELEDYVRAPTIEEERKQHPYLDWVLRQPRHFASPDSRKVARLKASYFGLMTEVDHNLGRLFEFMKQQDLWDNTLIIFTSDHGEQIGDHWLLGKMGYFDQSYHIPLIIRDPTPEADTARGSKIEGFTENIDIMPTMLEWYDVEAPAQCDGASLLRTAQCGELPANWRTEAHWEFDFRSVPEGFERESSLGLTPHQCTLNVIRDDQYKYVHFTNLPPLLFDLKQDPSELINLAQNPSHLQVVLQYAQKMLSWRMNHDEHALTHLSLTEEGVVSRRTSRY